MLLLGHIGLGRAAWGVVLAIGTGGAGGAGVIGLCLASAPAVAQDRTGGSPLEEMALASSPDAARPVEAGDGAFAYQLVEAWVRAGQVPDDDALPKVMRTRLLGVQVTLRDEGRLVSQGGALRPDPGAAADHGGAPADLAVQLAGATRAALADLKLSQRRRALELDISDPGLLEQSIDDLRARLQVDVQVGHSLESVVLPAHGPDDAVFAQFVPGFHGLRLAGSLMPDGDLLWPANGLARNTSPRSQLIQLLDRQGYEAEDLDAIGRPSGPRLERFEVVHYLQATAVMSPRELVRGNAAARHQTLDTRALGGMAERIARHLDAKIVALPDGERVLRGPYLPSYDQTRPELATTREAALACFALMAQSRSAQLSRPGDRVSLARAERAQALIDTVSELAYPAQGDARPVSVALLLLALCESPVPVDEDARDALAQTLLDLRREGGGYRAADGDERRAARAVEGVITAALASWCVVTDPADPTVRPEVWDAMVRLALANREDPGGARMADLTWLSVGYSRAGRQLAGMLDDPLVQTQLTELQVFFAEQLRELVDQQVQGTPLLGPNDVAGGYVTRPGPAGGAPNPTWESAMPLAIVAAGLRDPAVVAPDEIFGPLLSAQLGAGFIAKLLITDANAYYIRNREAASGGVRRSLWDNTLDLDCSSMALIALSELQTTLYRLERRDAEE